MAVLKYKTQDGGYATLSNIIVSEGGSGVIPVQVTGDSLTDVMSQSAVTRELSTKANANHSQASDSISAMTGYQIASSGSAITANDTLNQAIGKLEKLIAMLDARLDGLTLKKISQADYDDLETKDPNILYIIT